jgi:hypothetical protein
MGLALLLPGAATTSTGAARRNLIVRPSVLACSANLSVDNGTHVFTGRKLLPDQLTFFGHFRPASLAITVTKGMRSASFPHNNPRSIKQVCGVQQPKLTQKY